MELTPTTGVFVKHSLPEEERFTRFLAFFARQQGTPEEHIWDKMCLTPPLKEPHADPSAYIALYMQSDRNLFVFFETGGEVDPAAMALALYASYPLHPELWQRILQRDAALAESGVFALCKDDEGYMETLLERAAALPRHEDTWLPVGYAALSTGISGRGHLDFWCYSQLPAQPVWNTFRDSVVGGTLLNL